MDSILFYTLYNWWQPRISSYLYTDWSKVLYVEMHIKTWKFSGGTLIIYSKCNWIDIVDRHTVIADKAVIVIMQIVGFFSLKINI